MIDDSDSKIKRRGEQTTYFYQQLLPLVLVDGISIMKCALPFINTVIIMPDCRLCHCHYLSKLSLEWQKIRQGPHTTQHHHPDEHALALAWRKVMSDLQRHDDVTLNCRDVNAVEKGRYSLSYLHNRDSVKV